MRRNPFPTLQLGVKTNPIKKKSACCNTRLLFFDCVISLFIIIGLKSCDNQFEPKVAIHSTSQKITQSSDRSLDF